MEYCDNCGVELIDGVVSEMSAYKKYKLDGFNYCEDCFFEILENGEWLATLDNEEE